MKLKDAPWREMCPGGMRKPRGDGFVQCLDLLQGQYVVHTMSGIHSRPPPSSLCRSSSSIPRAVSVGRCLLSGLCHGSHGKTPAAYRRQPELLSDGSRTRTPGESPRLTQFNTRSKIRYSSSSTKLDASCGASTSSGFPPRILLIHVNLANRTLVSAAGPESEPTSSRFPRGRRLL